MQPSPFALLVRESGKLATKGPRARRIIAFRQVSARDHARPCLTATPRDPNLSYRRPGVRGGQRKLRCTRPAESQAGHAATAGVKSGLLGHVSTVRPVAAER